MYIEHIVKEVLLQMIETVMEDNFKKLIILGKVLVHSFKDLKYRVKIKLNWLKSWVIIRSLLLRNWMVVL